MRKLVVLIAAALALGLGVTGVVELGSSGMTGLAASGVAGLGASGVAKLGVSVSGVAEPASSGSVCLRPIRSESLTSLFQSTIAYAPATLSEPTGAATGSLV